MGKRNGKSYPLDAPAPTAERRMIVDNLASDAAKAKKAGLSYGQWKAMQKPVPIVPKPQTPGTRKICLYCGKEFFDKYNRNRKYCDDGCRNGAFDKKKRERLKACGQAKNAGDV